MRPEAQIAKLERDLAAAQERIAELERNREQEREKDGDYLREAINRYKEHAEAAERDLRSTKAALLVEEERCTQRMMELDAVRRDLAEARRDAERYRWLRDHYLPIDFIDRAHELPSGGYVFRGIYIRGDVLAWADTKDAAIDEAMGGKRE